MRRAPEQPSLEDLRAIAEFATAFDTPGFEPGEWTRPEPLPDGTILLGWWSPSETVMRWEESLYSRHIVDPGGEYLSKEFSARMRHFAADLSLLLEQDLPTIRTTLTNIVRGERFCDGYIAGMFECGVAQAATRRLGELAARE